MGKKREKMKKKIHISQGLRELIEEYLKAEAKGIALAKEVTALKSKVIQMNQKENRINIFWVFNERGKIKVAYWHEGLSPKEREKLEEDNSWALEQLSRNL